MVREQGDLEQELLVGIVVKRSTGEMGRLEYHANWCVGETLIESTTQNEEISLYQTIYKWIEEMKESGLHRYSLVNGWRIVSAPIIVGMQTVGRQLVDNVPFMDAAGNLSHIKCWMIERAPTTQMANLHCPCDLLAKEQYQELKEHIDFILRQ